MLSKNKQNCFLYFILGSVIFSLIFFQAKAGVSDNIAIIVNGVPVEHEVVHSEIEQNFQQMKMQYAQHIEQQPEFEQQLLHHVREQVISNYVNHLVLKTNAEDAGVEVSSDDIDAQFQMTEQQYPDREAFLSALSEAGFTPDSYRSVLEEQLQIDAFIQKNVDEPEVTEMEAREAFEANRHLFGGEDVSFEAARSQIVADLKRQKHGESVQLFINELKDESDIQVMYDEGAQVPPRQTQNQHQHQQPTEQSRHSQQNVDTISSDEYINAVANLHFLQSIYQSRFEQAVENEELAAAEQIQLEFQQEVDKVLNELDVTNEQVQEFTNENPDFLENPEVQQRIMMKIQQLSQ